MAEDGNKGVAEAQKRTLKAQEEVAELQSRTLRGKLKETSDKTHEKIEKSGWLLPALFIGFGAIFHLVHGSLSGWKWNDLFVPGIAFAALIGLFVVVMSFMSSRERGVKTLMFFAAAIIFEFIYYTLITSFLLQYAPTLDKRFLWNGFILVGVFSLGVSRKEWYLKLPMCYFIVLLLYPLAAPFVKAVLSISGLVKTTEAGERKSVTEGIKDLTVGTYAAFKCSMSYPADREQQRECEEEAKWRGATTTQREAMKKICEEDMDLSKCECSVYYNDNKKKEECIERKSEADIREIKGAAKDLTPMEIDFDVPKESLKSYSQKISINPTFTLINPYKEIDITLGCSIKDSTGEKLIESDFKDIIIPKEDTKTNEKLGYMKNFDCKSAAGVPRGSYNFELDATLNNVKTGADFTGLYIHPYRLESPTLEKDSIFVDERKSAFEDAYPTGEVESRSDPDLVWLSFSIDPANPSGIEGVNGLKTGSEFTLRVGLQNNKQSNTIMSVDNLEFLLPPIFSPTLDCLKVYSRSFEGDKVKLVARKDSLNEINFTNIGYSTKPIPLLTLSCGLTSNGELEKPNRIKSLIFTGSITYSHVFVETFKVTRVG